MKITTLEEEAASASAFTLDRDPRDRSGDRALARLGLLDDAVPLFADHECLPRAGALLAVPLLVRHGLIEAFVKVYGSLHPSFYGLRTIVVTLFLAALLRIKRAEHFKEYLPQDLGAILGLDRAPEVKTVRRKFAQLAARGRAKLLMDELARQRIAEDPERVAFLYLDGHVREYHGKFPLFEAKKAQRQVVTPAATDTWVHDADGEPLLVVTSEVNAKLTQVLEPILADVRRLVGDGRRMTVIFDRGGFSPKLFARLIAAGFDVITYRKGKVKKLPAGRFTVAARKDRRRLAGISRSATGRGFAWGHCPPRKREKASGPRHASGICGCGRCGCCGRTDARRPILTNREDLSAVMVPYRMFDRWRQENYFKYAEEEFALDALVEYGVEELPEATDRRNPQWLRLTRRLKEARAEVARLQGELGKEAAANQEASPADDAWIQDRACRAPPATPAGRGQDRAVVGTTPADAETDSGQRPEDAEDGEEADRGCDQDGRLPGGDRTVGDAPGPLWPCRRGRPHAASRRVPIACAAGSGGGRIAGDDCASILAASHGRAGGLVRATRRSGPSVSRHPSTSPLGCTGRRAYRILKGLCQEV